MKKNTTIILLYCSLQLLANLCYSQDNIILRNGDEIKAKVLEVTTDQIKYKKWDNQDGPTYSSAKSEVFMIKYQNGTKDVFKNTLEESNQTSNLDDKYSGNWTSSRRNLRLKITKNGNGYIVVSNDEGWENEKMTAKIENGDLNVSYSGLKFPIVIEQSTGNIIFDGERYRKEPSSYGVISNSKQPHTLPSKEKIDSFYIKDLNDPLENRPLSETPKYTCYYHSLDSILDYNIWDNCFFFKSNKPFKAKHFLAQFSGFTHTQNRDDLRARIGQNTRILIITPGLETKDKMLSYTISTSCTSIIGDKIFTKENVKQIQEKRLSNDLQSIYLTYNFDPKDFPVDKNQMDVYVNFEIRDNLSDFILSGFYKIKFFR